jgi:hypothetical protein
MCSECKFLYKFQIQFLERIIVFPMMF